MKLNFLNILKKKSTPDEIAEQVAALEVKKQQYEKERDKTKGACKEIRGRIMCGERIPPDVLRNIDRDYDDATLNLEMITDSIEELKRSLFTALEAYAQEEEERVAQLQRKRIEETEVATRELAKVKGRLVGLATAIYGHPQVAQDMLRQIDSFSFSNDHPHYGLFNEEMNRAMADLKHPTPADIETDYQAKLNWLREFKAENEHDRILEKYRSKYRAPEPQEQVVEV